MTAAKKTAKKKSTTDAIAFLEGQHREVERLFAEIEATESADEREALFKTLAQKIEAHAQIEEQIMYPAGKEVDKDLTLEAYVEHDAVRDLLAKIDETDAEDETFAAKITVLKEMIEHHVEEEEDTYFPEMRQQLGAERMEQLGDELKAAFAEIEPEVADEMPAAMAARKAAKAKASHAGESTR